jgi:chitin-binding protein
MKFDVIRTAVVCALVGATGTAMSHGLIQDPPSRNHFCGAVTKPDQVQWGTPQYPVCGDAFFAPNMQFADGYNFMSILTHTTGRAGVGPRTNVCSFNTETFGGRPIWVDQSINWPTNTMTSGQRTFLWNITWGPHFSDTAEFRYWITKPGFQYTLGRPLSFSDFEDAAFCTLPYNDATPTANPNVTPNPGAAQFTTRCNVPARSGRHVIYAEWGRNQFTFERFHTCVDVVFGAAASAVSANFSLAPLASVGTNSLTTSGKAGGTQETEITGTGSITLDARASKGKNLTYRWSVDSFNPSLYTLTNGDKPTATLTFNEPQAASKITVSLTVTSDGQIVDTTNRSLVHKPVVSNGLFDLGPVARFALNFAAGDKLQLRTVSTTGVDAYYPAQALVMTDQTAAASAWPLALAQAINSADGAVQIGVLDAKGAVVPSADATANHVYAKTEASLSSAFLQPARATVESHADHVH